MLPHYLGTPVLYHSDLVGRQDSHSGSIESHTADQNLFITMKILQYTITTSNGFCWNITAKKLSIRGFMI